MKEAISSVSDPHSLHAGSDPDQIFLTNADLDPIPDPNPGLKLANFFQNEILLCFHSLLPVI
jgi:hypothetical protein